MVISDPDYSTFPLPYELDWYEKDKCDPPDLNDSELTDSELVKI